jgi:hypothetical protein
MSCFLLILYHNQKNIEEILKKEVRDNYGLFLHANEEIKLVGVEVKSLKNFIESTRGFIHVRSYL